MAERTRRFAAFALTATVVLATVACDGGDTTRSNEADRSPTTVPEAGWVSSFLAPGVSAAGTRDLFEVEATRAQYWRLFALDRFDGRVWTSSGLEGSQDRRTLTTPATLPQVPGSIDPAASETLDQTFRILSDFDSAHAVPMAQNALEIGGSIGDITWDPAGGQAFVEGGLEAGMEYTVRSRLVAPTSEELDRVEYRAPAAYGRWTALPADLDPRFAAIAGRWTTDATSAYRKVLAIQQHFHDGSFVYSTDVEPADDAGTLVDFLTDTKTGFCQQYAASMVILVRSLGLPARVAVGYRAGIPQEDGSYVVRASDAHSWVEVLFPGYGWLPFEPEAGAALPNAEPGTYLSPLGSMMV